MEPRWYFLRLGPPARKGKRSWSLVGSARCLFCCCCCCSAGSTHDEEEDGGSEHDVTNEREGGSEVEGLAEEERDEACGAEGVNERGAVHEEGVGAEGVDAEAPDEEKRVTKEGGANTDVLEKVRTGIAEVDVGELAAEPVIAAVVEVVRSQPEVLEGTGLGGASGLLWRATGLEAKGAIASVTAALPRIADLRSRADSAMSA